jgi:hypothetical protein
MPEQMRQPYFPKPVDRMGYLYQVAEDFHSPLQRWRALPIDGCWYIDKIK